MSKNNGNGKDDLPDVDDVSGTLAELAPELIKLGTVIFKAGNQGFDDWAEEMREACDSPDDNLSERIEPFLGKIYEIVKLEVALEDDPLEIIKDGETLPLSVAEFTDRARLKTGLAFDERPDEEVAREILKEYPDYLDKVLPSDDLTEARTEIEDLREEVVRLRGEIDREIANLAAQNSEDNGSNGKFPPDEYLGHVEEEFEEVDPSTLDPDLARDLWDYDNPQAFFNLSLPQLYKLRIVSLHLGGDDATVLQIGVRGDNLPNAIAESYLRRLGQPQMLEAMGYETYEQMHSELLGDRGFNEHVYAMRDFYVRHLPKVAVRLFDIMLTMAVVYGHRRVIEVETAEDASKREALAREEMDRQIKALRGELGQMLKLRRAHRPKKIRPKKPPLLACKVWEVACRLQGDRRGKGTAPGFAAVALEYDPTITENALRKRLIAAMWPWEIIKKDLEERQ